MGSKLSISTFYVDHLHTDIISLPSDVSAISMKTNFTNSEYFKHLPIVQKKGHKASLVCDWNQDHNTPAAAGKHLDYSASQDPPEADN